MRKSNKVWVVDQFEIAGDGYDDNDEVLIEEEWSVLGSVQGGHAF